MEELKNALDVRKRYNDMPFDEFVEMFETYTGRKVPDREREMFRFTGLLNTDFFLMNISAKNWESI